MNTINKTETQAPVKVNGMNILEFIDWAMQEQGMSEEDAEKLADIEFAEARRIRDEEAFSDNKPARDHQKNSKLTLAKYMEKLSDGEEVTCWDKDVDSEFYFYKKDPNEKPDPDFPSVAQLEDYLVNKLEISEINSNGVTVNLYDFIEKSGIIPLAQEKLYDEHQYEDESDVQMLLFDDIVLNLSYGYEEFSKEVLACFTEAEANAKSKIDSYVFDFECKEKLQEIYTLAIELMNLSPDESKCSNEWNEVFDDIANLKNSLGNVINELSEKETSTEKRSVDGLISEAQNQFLKEDKASPDVVLEKEAER